MGDDSEHDELPGAALDAYRTRAADDVGLPELRGDVGHLVSEDELEAMHRARKALYWGARDALRRLDAGDVPGAQKLLREAMARAGRP